jgi:hypothetical protein
MLYTTSYLMACSLKALVMIIGKGKVTIGSLRSVESQPFSNVLRIQILSGTTVILSRGTRMYRGTQFDSLSAGDTIRVGRLR